MAQEIILCDTNVIIEFIKKNQQTFNILDNIGFENIAISDVTLMELYFGAINKEELESIKRSLSFLKRKPITSKISTQAVELIEEYSKSHGLTLPDGLIAATALHSDISLFTYNLKDFRYIDGLRLYSEK